MQFPKTITRNINDLTLSWENIYGSNSNYTYTLQICDNFKEWKTIYRGPKTEFKIDMLAPCTCYNLRIKASNDLEWLEFKAATEDVAPFTSVIHMTRAVKLGKTSVVRKIASIKPILLNAENKENKTPLFQAIDVKDLQMMHLLIMLGANVNKSLIHSGRTPLMYAIYKRELQAAALLIDKGASIHHKDINGLTILHYAVDSNDLNTVQFAVESGLDINVQDNNGWTALIRAVILQSHREIMEYLLKNGALKTIKDKNGFDYYKHLYIMERF